MSLVQAISAPPQIAAALQQASAKTGTDFNYLLKTAMRESSLDCSAKSSTSSACGLFQFTQQTWLGTMKKNGGDLGLGQYADAISQDSKGRYVVADPAARQAILALRNDPTTSALMAGAYTSDSQQALEGKLGRSVSGGELYIAHFLGAGGASKLISSAEDAPNARADVLFPDAAAANRSIFYGRDGQPRTVAEVYKNLVAKHQGGSSSPRFEIAPQPQLDDANTASLLPASLGTLSSALAGTGRGDASETKADASTAALSPYASAYSGTYSSAYSSSNRAGLSAAGLGSRSPLKMSPAVVQMLASLDTSGLASSAPEVHRAEDDKDEDRKDVRRMMPRGGLSLG
ncbi:MAG TPA: transglycosylase SLT domain-containing protein [Parvibaculum sp.]|jgi:hypothetical protein